MSRRARFTIKGSCVVAGGSLLKENAGPELYVRNCNERKMEAIVL